MESTEGTRARRGATAKSRRSGARGKALGTPRASRGPGSYAEKRQHSRFSPSSFSAPAVSGAL
jgi:hypothetical protein